MRSETVVSDSYCNSEDIERTSLNARRALCPERAGGPEINSYIETGEQRLPHHARFPCL
jgi:hypothetical protein